MRKFLNAVVLIPLGVIFVVFAVANRHMVTVSFDPFNSNDPALGFHPAALRGHHCGGHLGGRGGRLGYLVQPAPLAPRGPAA